MSWSDARLRGGFNTLQLCKGGVPQLQIPLANGGEIQFLPKDKNYRIHFNKVKIIRE